MVEELKAQGYRLFATGEMGIGNTTTSSAVASVLLGQPVETMTGRGAGLSSDGLTRKIQAIKKAIDLNKPDDKRFHRRACKKLEVLISQEWQVCILVELHYRFRFLLTVLFPELPHL